MTPEQHKKNVEDSARIISEAAGSLKPKLGLILGSGLGGLADKIERAVTIPYAELPGFPQLTVAGHAGLLVVGMLGGAPVIALKGRKHFYETDDPYPLKTMIRALKLSGIETLFLSNAAGSLRPHIGVGSIMLITDHINMTGISPLAGANDDAFGPRFFAMTDAWDKNLCAVMRDTAKQLALPLAEGTYMAVRGPMFETPAEIRMAQSLGADAIAMSTVPDCIIARHCGLKVVGCSCITNMGAGLSDEVLSHAHTLENAAKVAADFERLVIAAAGRLA